MWVLQKKTSCHQKRKKMKIAIDLTGSDVEEDIITKTLLKSYKNSTISFVLIGSQNSPKPLPKNFSFIKAKNIISQEDTIISAIRRKKDSSISLGINLLKKKEVDAFISAGNTKALLSLGKIYLNTLTKNISRPSLLALFPSKNKTLAVLDVGANASCKTKFLMESAILGIAFQNWQGIKKPKLGLLNIGSEEKKGTSEIQKTYFQLKELSKKYKTKFEFLGNIEGKEVFKGDIDILVTDGFTGNVFLKTSEGIANFIIDTLSQNKLFKPNLSNLKKYLHYEKYPGALLCGVNGIIIKCHGYSSVESFLSAIEGAIHFFEKNLISSMKSSLKAFPSTLTS
jgi:glycerol-3-phosphate acyltransferase PlsX